MPNLWNKSDKLEGHFQLESQIMCDFWGKKRGGKGEGEEDDTWRINNDGFVIHDRVLIMVVDRKKKFQGRAWLSI